MCNDTVLAAILDLAAMRDFAPDASQEFDLSAFN